MLTLAAPLSREVGEGLPKVREYWWELSLGSYRGMGAEFIRLAAGRGQGLQVPKLPTALAATRIRHTIPERRDQCEHRAGRPGAPPGFDFDIYRKRNVVERSVNQFKQLRGIATRYEKRAVNCRAMVVIAALMIWLSS